MSWQPIETAPRDGSWFWAFWPVQTVADQQQSTTWDGDRFIDHADHMDWLQPTHWMPLPEAPDA